MNLVDIDDNHVDCYKRHTRFKHNVKFYSKNI